MAQTVTVDGRTEEEYRLDINRAIADTEDEIFREAMSDQELDNDSDNTLEQMEDHPLDEDVEPEEDQEEVLEAEPEEGAEEEPQEIEEEFEQAEEPADEPEPELPRIPSHRVRDLSEARRQVEERNIALERELAMVRGRMDEMSARLNQTPPQPTARPRTIEEQLGPKPDRYTNEAEFDDWNVRRGRLEAEQVFEQRFARMQQEQQLQMAQRVEASFGAAANSERRIQFLDAYDRLTHLDPNNPINRATVMGIAQSADPAAALFGWFEGYQEPEERYEQPRQRRAAREPVHEVRLPTRPPTRSGPPSLNSMGGGGPGQRVDPEMYDDSDAAVFRYATRR
jgi:hypothetical protein